MGVTVQNLTFRSPAPSFFESMVNFFFLCMFLNDAQQNMQKNVWLRAQNSVKNNFFPPCLETYLP